MSETHARDVAGMEAAYDLIAQAIDRAGPSSEVFLAKALFILASRHTSPEVFAEVIEDALLDL